MTNLRQGRWLRSLFAARGASSFTTAALVGTGLLLPGTAVASPHSHARHPLPTALHSTAVSDTGSHAGSRSRKGTAKAKPGAHAAGASSSAGSAAHHGGKGSKGRRQKAEPADEFVPMYRAKRGAAPLEHEGRGLAHSGRNGRQEAFSRGPAPLASAYRHGAHVPVVTTARVADREIDARSGHIPHTAPASPRWVAPRHEQAVNLAPAPKGPATVAVNRPEAYAEGVSHPDDDERMPRVKATDDDSQSVSATVAPITRILPAATPTARVSANSTPAPVAPAAQSPVVQGFGAEVALPSTSGTERPGGTRRRNHPSNWQPESMVMPPQPLEEREAITEAAVSPMVLPEVYDRNGRLVMPAPLKGSHDVLVHQNVMATSDGLERIYDDVDLDRLRAAHLLVSFPATEGLRVNEDLPYNRRVARPWTVSFATDMAAAYYARFHQPIWLTSAVRTVHYQAHLQMVNGNAAAISGDAASPHLTGQAVDFGKRGMSSAQLAWMRDYLLPLMRTGKIDVEEEFHQACFHVSVYRSYNAGRHAAREYARVQPDAAGAVSGGVPEDDR